MKWFKHDSSSSADAKIKKLILRHGPEGYAVYFHCLELICSAIEPCKITFELEHDAEIIAENLRIKSDTNLSAIEKVEAIMRTIINLELFEHSEGKITCLKLAQRIENSIIKSPQLREIQNNIRDNPGKSRLDKIRLDKNRIDKKRDNTTLTLSFFSDEFKTIWERWTRYKKEQFKFRYKSQDSEQAAVNLLQKMSNNNPITAVQIVDQSIANGWKGFFELKTIAVYEPTQAAPAAENIQKTIDIYYTQLKHRMMTHEQFHNLLITGKISEEVYDTCLNSLKTITANNPK